MHGCVFSEMECNKRHKVELLQWDSPEDDISTFIK